MIAHLSSSFTNHPRRPASAVRVKVTSYLDYTCFLSSYYPIDMKYNIDICPYLSWLLISKGIKMDQAENFYALIKKVSQIYSFFGTFRCKPKRISPSPHIPPSEYGVPFENSKTCQNMFLEKCYLSARLLDAPSWRRLPPLLLHRSSNAVSAARHSMLFLQRPTSAAATALQLECTAHCSFSASTRQGELQWSATRMGARTAQVY